MGNDRMVNAMDAKDDRASPILVDRGALYDRLSVLVHELRIALLDQATDKKLTALALRRRSMKLRNKIAAFYGQE